MNTRIILTAFILLTGISEVWAQSPAGFWEITKVEVAGREMTPVAKWTKINTDGTYQSGNGWQQNSEGSWKFSQENELFTTNEKNGLKDEYGPFSVSFGGKNHMTWKREEEGMIVTVSLEKTEILPRSTADKLYGLWDLEQAEKDGLDITEAFDADDKFYLYITWDRMYQERNSAGEKERGYWHINAHRPEMIMINQADHTDSGRWRVEVSDQKLKLTGISKVNNGVIRSFRRIDRFPEN